MLDAPHYWLKNARIPEPLMVRSKQGRSRQWLTSTAEIPGDRDFMTVDLEILDGQIASIAAAGMLQVYGCPSVDLRGKLVWPCFVDLHTHLDKGHIWGRSPNPDGTFASALTAVRADTPNWSAEDIYRRMEFSLKCAYAHGTVALRTHIDSVGAHAVHSWEAITALREAWHDRLTIQAACLVTLDHYLTPEGEALADRMAEIGGILGGVGYQNDALEAQVDRVFALAKERKLAIDLHVDETDDPESRVLDTVAKTAMRYKLSQKVTCGHCCSLAVQPPEMAMATIQRVKRSGVAIVSLPLCNLYLQDRVPGRTPRWRGVTLLQEFKTAGVPVAIASDNTRDPFYGFGDLDALEVFSWSAKIGHLDHPYSDWCRSVTLTPADIMGVSSAGRIGVGLPADLVIFKARNYSELLSRPQSDRILLRNGKRIEPVLPNYDELEV